jgi:hypothetical protein
MYRRNPDFMISGFLDFEIYGQAEPDEIRNLQISKSEITRS